MNPAGRKEDSRGKIPGPPHPQAQGLQPLGLGPSVCYSPGMNYLQTLLLAVIQGAAELLPVSSSAHVIFAEKLMGLDPSSPEMVFLLVMLHTGTMFAVLVYFWPRWRRLLFQKPAAEASGFLARHHFITMVVL